MGLGRDINKNSFNRDKDKIHSYLLVVEQKSCRIEGLGPMKEKLNEHFEKIEKDIFLILSFLSLSLSLSFSQILSFNTYIVVVLFQQHRM
jgi:hypothetical protein